MPVDVMRDTCGGSTPPPAASDFLSWSTAPAAPSSSRFRSALPNAARASMRSSTAPVRSTIRHDGFTGLRWRIIFAASVMMPYQAFHNAAENSQL